MVVFTLATSEAAVGVFLCIREPGQWGSQSPHFSYVQHWLYPVLFKMFSESLHYDSTLEWSNCVHKGTKESSEAQFWCQRSKYLSWRNGDNSIFLKGFLGLRIGSSPRRRSHVTCVTELRAKGLPTIGQVMQLKAGGIPKSLRINQKKLQRSKQLVPLIGGAFLSSRYIK